MPRNYKPVYNRNSRPIRKNDLGYNNEPITIIIPCAGTGKRMKSYGNRSLLSIKGEYLICYQIRLIREIFQNCEIIIVVGFESDKIINCLPPNIKVVENETYEENNVTKSINLALRISSHNSCLIIYGDILFNREAIQEMVGPDSTSLVCFDDSFEKENVGVILNDAYLCSLSYGIPIKWGQIFYLNSKELEMFKKEVGQKTKSKYFGYEILNDIIDKGAQIKWMCPPNLYLREIDTPSDYKRIINENCLCS